MVSQMGVCVCAVFSPDTLCWVVLKGTQKENHIYMFFWGGPNPKNNGHASLLKRRAPLCWVRHSWRKGTQNESRDSVGGESYKIQQAQST